MSSGHADFHPEALISLDFETFYSVEFTLSKLTTEAYVRDPRFQVIGVAVKVDNGPAVWMMEGPFREWASRVDWSRVAACAHNSCFDGFILSEKFGVYPRFWFDTLSMSRPLHRMNAGGSLKALMAFYDVGEKGTFVHDAKGLRLEDFTPQQLAEYGDYCRRDVDGCHAILFKMLANGFPEKELWKINLFIKMYTEPEFRINEPLLHDYYLYEQERKRELMMRLVREAEPTAADNFTEGDMLAMIKKILMSNDRLARLFMDLGVEPPTKISVAKTKTALSFDENAEPVMTWAFAKSDPGMQELLEHDDLEVRMVAEARVGVKSTINETRTKRFLESGKNGQAVTLQIMYAKAHTFRTAGGDRKNPQNLERTNKKNPRKGTLRRSLIPVKGKKVVVADSGQIEARFTAWMAGHSELLVDFAQNVDVYSKAASDIYMRHVDRKKNAEDEIAGHIGKASVLGLGFGMGYEKFSLTLLQGALGGPKVKFTQADADVMQVNVGKFADNKKALERVAHLPTVLSFEDMVMHVAVCQAIVYRWRDKNQPIVRFWKLCEHVIKAMVDGDEVTFGPGDVYQTVRHGVLMPNGLVMYFPGLAESEEGGYSYLSQYSKQRIYIHGAKLVENLVQSSAYIAVSDQMVDVYDHYGLRCKLFAHDELVYVEPEEIASSALAGVLHFMKRSPTWAPTIPLHAEGGIGDNYGDAKA